MRPHSLICRLGITDGATVPLARADTRVTDISFIAGERRLDHGLGQALDHLHSLGFHTSERAVVESTPENTLRGRSFLFFALAALAASGFDRDVIIHVPENGLISLNLPLDPLRLGANSTRTTHPFYMARWNELLAALGVPARLENRYRHRTKGQMVEECAACAFLRR